MCTQRNTTQKARLSGPGIQLRSANYSGHLYVTRLCKQTKSPVNKIVYIQSNVSHNLEGLEPVCFWDVPKNGLQPEPNHNLLNAFECTCLAVHCFIGSALQQGAAVWIPEFTKQCSGSIVQ